MSTNNNIKYLSSILKRQCIVSFFLCTKSAQNLEQLILPEFLQFCSPGLGLADLIGGSLMSLLSWVCCWVSAGPTDCWAGISIPHHMACHPPAHFHGLLHLVAGFQKKARGKTQWKVLVKFLYCHYCFHPTGQSDSHGHAPSQCGRTQGSLNKSKPSLYSLHKKKGD